MATVQTGARVGADLRAARERLGWTLPAIAAHLRIRLPYLEAIEDGRIADLPGNAYAIGFVRTYGQALGLDPDEVGRRFRAEASDINRKTHLDFPAPVPERGIPIGAMVLIGGLIAAGTYVGWYELSGNGRPVTESAKPVPARLAPLADKAAASLAANMPIAKPPAPPSPIPPQMLSGPIVPPSSAAAAIPSPLIYGQPLVASAAPVLPERQASNRPVPMVRSTGGAVTPIGPAGPLVLADPSRPDGSQSDRTRVLVRARTDTWVQVRERQGGVLLNRVMRSGETWQVPTRPNLFLTTGNAGGTEIVVDGTAIASLGGDGTVRRDIALDPDDLKASGPAADANSEPNTGSPGPRPAATKPH